jgi:hypothetical protein
MASVLGAVLLSLLIRVHDWEGETSCSLLVSIIYGSKQPHHPHHVAHACLV